MKGKITKILTIMLMVVITCSPTAFCAASGTVRMKIDNSEPWTNITVSDSYEECISLNSTNSTLGTAAMEAHLTTDYDWSAMAILSVSQYGAATTNKLGNNSTTKNKSGVFDIGVTNYTQTTGLLSTSTNTSTPYVGGLYDTSGNLKKYVNKIDIAKGTDQNGRTCIPFVVNGGTKGWLGSEVWMGTYNPYPVSIKLGLFGLYLGEFTASYVPTTGMGGTEATFRPVIWN